MFLHLCVILFIGGEGVQTLDADLPRQTPPQMQTPWVGQTPPPPDADHEVILMANGFVIQVPILWRVQRRIQDFPKGGNPKVDVNLLFGQNLPKSSLYPDSNI